MNKINHPNVMHLFEFLESSNNYYMVIQYCNGGDLESHIRKQPNGLLSEGEAVYYLKQIMNGFTILHAEKIMHRDFKLANIFLHDGKAVIGDFGFAKAGYEMANTKLGTPVTMAPELHMEKTSYNNKADLWSIGVVFFEMLYGDNPFFGLNIQEIMSKIRAKSGPNLKFDESLNKISDLSKDLLRKLLEMDPDRRIEWEGFFKHPLFDAAPTDLASPGLSPEAPKKIMQEPSPINRVQSNQSHAFDMGGVFQQQGSDTDECKWRYLHEKNKAQMIFWAIKRLRALIKDPDYYELSRYIYLLTLVLARKGIFLLELTIYSLEQGTNVFETRGLEEFKRKSEEYLEMVALLKADLSRYQGYENFLKDIKSELNLLPDDLSVIDWLYVSFRDLEQLDDKATTLFYQIQSMDKPNKLLLNSEANRQYHLAMYLVIQVIHSEKHLPYLEGGKKVEWHTLMARYQSMSPDMLKRQIQAASR